MPACLVVRLVPTTGLENAAPHIVAEDDREKELLAADRILRQRRGCQRGRQHDGSRMVASTRVVEFEGMTGNGIDEGRGADGKTFARSPDRHVASLLCGQDQVESGLGFLRGSSCDTASQCIEGMACGLDADRLRQIRRRGGGDELGKRDRARCRGMRAHVRMNPVEMTIGVALRTCTAGIRLRRRCTEGYGVLPASPLIMMFSTLAEDSSHFLSTSA